MDGIGFFRQSRSAPGWLSGLQSPGVTPPRSGDARKTEDQRRREPEKNQKNTIEEAEPLKKFQRSQTQKIFPSGIRRKLFGFCNLQFHRPRYPLLSYASLGAPPGWHHRCAAAPEFQLRQPRSPVQMLVRLHVFFRHKEWETTHLTVLGTHPMYNILSCKKLKVLLHQSFYITIYWLSKAEDLHTHANYHYEAPSRKAIWKSQIETHVFFALRNLGPKETQ